MGRGYNGGDRDGGHSDAEDGEGIFDLLEVRFKYETIRKKIKQNPDNKVQKLQVADGG